MYKSILSGCMHYDIPNFHLPENIITIILDTNKGICIMGQFADMAKTGSLPFSLV